MYIYKFKKRVLQKLVFYDDVSWMNLLLGLSLVSNDQYLVSFDELICYYDNPLQATDYYEHLLMIIYMINF